LPVELRNVTPSLPILSWHCYALFAPDS